jgi:hypothetical protein
MKNEVRQVRIPGPYGVARLVANDSYFQHSVIRLNTEHDVPATALDARVDRLANKAPLVERLAGCMVYCERVLPKLPIERMAATLWMSFVMLLLLIVVERARNEITTTIKTGIDDDVRSQFKLAERLALAQQRELRGYRAPSRGPARNARSTYFAYLEVLHGMKPAAVRDQWLELTSSWLAGAVPQTSSPEWDAYIEWQAVSRQPEVLEETNIRVTLRAWRARHESSATTLGLAANTAPAG